MKIQKLLPEQEKLLFDLSIKMTNEYLEPEDVYNSLPKEYLDSETFLLAFVKLFKDKSSALKVTPDRFKFDKDTYLNLLDYKNPARTCLSILEENYPQMLEDEDFAKSCATKEYPSLLWFKNKEGGSFPFDAELFLIGLQQNIERAINILDSNDMFFQDFENRVELNGKEVENFKKCLIYVFKERPRYLHKIADETKIDVKSFLNIMKEDLNQEDYEIAFKKLTDPKNTFGETLSNASIPKEVIVFLCEGVRIPLLRIEVNKKHSKTQPNLVDIFKEALHKRTITDIKLKPEVKSKGKNKISKDESIKKKNRRVFG